MTSVPYVELTYGPSALDLATRQRLARPREERSLQEAMADALTAWRAHVITEVRSEVKRYTTIDAITINKLLDRMWSLYTPKFYSLIVPFLVGSYASGFAQASAGKVPPEYLESLARDYAQRLGGYYHTSSKEALVQGFQTYVNRRVGAKVALDRALMAYGLTPRQMSGYTSLDIDTKVSSAQNLSLRAKSMNYVSESLRRRMGFLVEQEKHNVDQQAQQMAWMWLERRGRLSKNAMKTWITAKDEKVCPLCGPLHGMKIPVLEKFPVGEGSMWVPGVHPNCRCEVRLTQLLTPVSKSQIVKADKWYNDEYIRNSKGEFARKRETLPERPPEVRERSTEPIIETTEEVETKPVVLGKPKEVVLGKPKPVLLSKPSEVVLGKPGVTEPTVLGKPQEKVTLGSRAQAIELSLKRKGIQLEQQRQQVTLAREARRRAKRFRVEHRHEIEPLPTPIYKVLAPIDVEMVTNEYTFAGDAFMTDRLAALRAADEIRERLINSKLLKLTTKEIDPNIPMDDWSAYVEKDMVPVTHYDPEVGGHVTAVITPQEAREVLVAMARYDAEEIVSGVDYDLEFYDSDGQYIEEPVNVGLMEMAEMLGIKPGDFAVEVVEITHAHQGEAGSWQHHSGTKYGFEEYTIRGDYEGVSQTEETSDHDGSSYLKIPVIGLWPIHYSTYNELIEYDVPEEYDDATAEWLSNLDRGDEANE